MFFETNTSQQYKTITVRCSRNISYNSGYQLDIEGKPVSLEILDTGGNESFIGMRDLDISHGDGFILVFDTTNESSINYLANIRNHIIQVKDEQVPIVLVGSKMDKSRKSSLDKARSTADDWDCKYIETSSLTGKGVQEVFCELATQICSKR
jgi:small GTP-binding protein